MSLTHWALLACEPRKKLVPGILFLVEVGHKIHPKEEWNVNVELNRIGVNCSLAPLRLSHLLGLCVAELDVHAVKLIPTHVRKTILPVLCPRQLRFRVRAVKKAP